MSLLQFKNLASASNSKPRIAYYQVFMAIRVPQWVGVVEVGKPYFWISSPLAEKVDRSYHRGMRDVALTSVPELFVAEEAAIKESGVAAIK